MSQYTGTLIESQVDWLTVSAHGEDRAKLLLDLGVRLAKEEAARGNRPRKWRQQGYEGISVGRAQYGQRDRNATELRLSGDLAARELDVSTSLADGFTRLDLAVTWRADQPSPDLGDWAAKAALDFHRHKPRSARPWAVMSEGTVNTLYLGERASEYFFRLYDKEREERHSMGALYDGRYDRCWRWELELKASIPHQVLRKLLATKDRAEWIRSYVHSYAAAHGLQPPFECAGPMQLVPGFRRKSDAASKLMHISRNVRPTCNWLKEAGYERDLRIALGEPDPDHSLTILQHILERHSVALPLCRTKEGGENG